MDILHFVFYLLNNGKEKCPCWKIKEISTGNIIIMTFIMIMIIIIFIININGYFPPIQ